MRSGEARFAVARDLVACAGLNVALVHGLRHVLGQEESPGGTGEAVVQQIIGTVVSLPVQITHNQHHERPHHPERESNQNHAGNKQGSIVTDGQDEVPDHP